MIFLTVFFSLSFIVCGADIPYFNQFFDRFNVHAFSWMEGDGGLKFVVNMIVEEPRYWLILIPIILLSIIYYLIVNQIFKKTEKWERGKYVSKAVYTIILLGLMVLGIRGRLDEKSPIRVGTAYYCNNAFLNQLGLNPNYTLIQSYLDVKNSKNQESAFMDDKQALKCVQNYLNISTPNTGYPVSRMIESGSLPNNYNVILVIMESMSADKMTRFGNTQQLTPFLDSLSNQGLFFENCYTSGIHTYNGIYSTLFSYPTIYRQHPLKQTPILSYNGIANILKANNYSTTFFLTHDANFDNINGFLMANDFDRIISKSDYPIGEIKTTLGVPDDYLFRFSIPVINKLHKQNKPFFAAFMTASDHGPYYIPEYFSATASEKKEQVIQYADYSLQKLITLAKQQPWFDSTIFVFVADHGYSNNAIYSIPISYIHSPLLFYAPNLIKDTVINNIAGQIDIFPTIMGLLNISYVNNTFGIDLLKETRPFTVSTGDDKFAVLDDEWLLIVNYKDPKPTQLFKYKNRDTFDYSTDYPEIVESMKQFGESNLQATQYILRNRKQKVN